MMVKIQLVLVEDSSTSCLMFAKVRKIVATTKQKRTKS